MDGKNLAPAAWAEERLTGVNGNWPDTGWMELAKVIVHDEKETFEGAQVSSGISCTRRVGDP